MSRRAAPVVWVSFAMVVGMLGAALISPLYAVYKVEWQLQASDISLTYVIYMLGALFSLLVFGRLPDRLGPYSLLAASLVLSVIGSVITMLAGSIGLLFLGRFIVGLASSITTSAGAAALSQHLPEAQRHRMSLIFSLVVGAGFGIGPLLGGLSGQFAPAPLQSAYLPPILLCLLALLTLHIFVRGKGPRVVRKPLRLGDLLPKLTLPAQGQRLRFFLICFSPFLAFAAFGLYASMVPLFISDMMHLKGPLVSGVSIASILLFSSLAQILMQRLSAVTTVRIGTICLALSSAALMVNLQVNASIIFMSGVMLTAVGHGASMLGSMSLLTRSATIENRSGLTASYMVIGYCGAVLSVLGLGWAADHLGLQQAVAVFCGVSILLSLGLLVLNAIRGGGAAED